MKIRIRSDEGLTLETSAFESLYGGQFTLSPQLIKPNYPLKISMTSLIIIICRLNFFPNSLLYYRNVFESSFKVVKNLPKPLEISESVRERSCDPRTSFGESLEIFGKWSVGNLWKIVKKAVSSLSIRSLRVSSKI